MALSLLLSSCLFTSDKPDGSGEPSGYVEYIDSLSHDTLRTASLNMAVGFSTSQLAFVDFNSDTAVYAELKNLLTELDNSLPDERIRLMAREIAVLDLDVIGLQEVLSMIVNDTVHSDFITQLHGEILAQGGPDYTYHHDTLNTIRLGPYYFADTLDVRFSEGNAVLVHPRHMVTSAFSLLYSQNASVPALGDTIVSERGVNIVALQSPAGKRYQVFNTHIEIANILGIWAPIQSRQTADLAYYADSLREDGITQVLLGDFNGETDDTHVQLILQEGWVDFWGEAGQGPGGTCCVDFRMVGIGFNGPRIDYVLASHITKVLSAEVVLDQWQLTNSGDTLYPSDHAMVVGELESQF